MNRISKTFPIVSKRKHTENHKKPCLSIRRNPDVTYEDLFRIQHRHRDQSEIADQVLDRHGDGASSFYCTKQNKTPTLMFLGRNFQVL